MNIWTRKSIELANQKNYLDLLYRVYPISENVRREISDSTKNDISNFFNGRNNIELLKILIDQTNKKQIVFPIKDSYVAFLKHDNSAIDRNPKCEWVIVTSDKGVATLAKKFDLRAISKKDFFQILKRECKTEQ